MAHSKPNQGTEIVGDKAWESFAQAVTLFQERRPTGKGWFERDEVMRRMGIRSSRFKDLMRKAIDAGLVERFNGIVQSNGALRTKTFYRRIKQPVDQVR